MLTATLEKQYLFIDTVAKGGCSKIYKIKEV